MSDEDVYKTRETLLDKLKNQNDEASWEEFAFYYRKFIYMICRRMDLNHHDAQDVVQKVLVYSWNKLPDFTYDENKKFRGWLCMVTMNYAKNSHRDRKRHNAKIDNAAKDSHPDERAGVSPEIVKIADQEWRSYIANLALANISDKFSDKVLEVFQRARRGATVTQIAEEMGIPRNTVSVYKKRATAKLMEEVNRLNGELG